MESEYERGGERILEGVCHRMRGGSHSRGQESSVHEIYEVLKGYGARHTLCIQTNREWNNMKTETKPCKYNHPYEKDRYRNRIA